MHLKTVAKYMRRSPYQSLSAALIMTLTFFAISVFAVLTLFSIRLVNYLETRPQLTVFFKDEATQEEISGLQSQLRSTAKTTSIVFVSKEEALKIYREQNKNDPVLLDLVTAEILPASVEIQATKAEYLSDLANIVRGSPAVEEVVFQQDIVDSLTRWTNGFRVLGIAVISVLVVVSIFVILTIIGIKITVRRDEIEIMKLIGASHWFIRMPFLLEGMIYGFIGALLGWVATFGIWVLLRPYMNDFLQGLSVINIEPLLLLEILVMEIIIACFLGAFASFLAVLRYIK